MNPNAYLPIEARRMSQVFSQLGVGARVPMDNRTPAIMDCPSFVSYRLQLATKTQPKHVATVMAKLDEEISTLRSAHGFSLTNPLRLSHRPLTIEGDHPSPRTLEWPASPPPWVLGRMYGLGGAQTITWEPERHPHVLIAGTTGSGKTNLIHGLLLSTLQHHSPAQVRLALVDFKIAGLSPYTQLPHSVGFSYNDDTAIRLLNWLKAENDHRMYLAAQGDNLDSKPRILVVIDELASLMAAKPRRVMVEELLATARSQKINIVAAIQNPNKEYCGDDTNYGLRLVGSVTDDNAARYAAGRGGSQAHKLPRNCGAFLHVDGPTVSRLQTYLVTREQVDGTISRVGGES